MGIVAPAVLLVVCLAVMLLAGGLVGFALGITGLVLIYALLDPALAANSINVLFTNLNSFVLAAVPMFVLIGEIVVRSGMGDDLYKGLSALLAGLPGGLLHTNVASCAGFAAISGSSVATAATMGTIAFPEQIKRGYDSQMVIGSLAGSGTLGLLIPPSITLLIYGAIVGESVGKLFMGGFVPGAMFTVMFMSYIAIRCKLQPNKAPQEAKVPWKSRLLSLPLLLPVACIFLLILGGIYLGVMTPTEAAGVGVIVAVIIAAVQRRLSWRVVRDSISSTTEVTGMVFLITAGAFVLQFGLTSTGMPRHVASVVLSLQLPPLGTMFGIYLMYLLMGCFFEGISMMLLTLPLVYPIVMELGFDSVWFGVILTMLIEEAQISPPVGLNLFVLHGICKRPIGHIVKGSVPYFIMLFIGIIICTYFPRIILWLPSMMMPPVR